MPVTVPITLTIPGYDCMTLLTAITLGRNLSIETVDMLTGLLLPV